jgi:hypothetical protein
MNLGASFKGFNPLKRVWRNPEKFEQFPPSSSLFVASLLLPLAAFKMQGFDK